MGQSTTVRCLLVLVVFGGVALTRADQIPDRDTLDAILGPHQILEDFESFSVADGDAQSLDVWELDDSTVTLGQGPKLVEPGATYLDPAQDALVWNGHDYFGLQSKTIEARGGGTLEIHYSTDVRAMGIDFRAFDGYGYDGSVAVYDADGALLGGADFALISGGSENVFFGWENDAGIGWVEIVSPTFSWSPLIDNHGYGVPEPGSLALLALASLAALRRR